ncbi:MAG: hypothetical protein M3323_03355 [Actinomycetota bacterium]|nr:hypothetical protein [Actinomycetota bacterium]
MRRKISIVAAGLLAGATLSISAGSPAHACHDATTGEDPVVNYVCGTSHNLPDPGPWIQHYYDEAGRVVYRVYCTLWPPC